MAGPRRKTPWPRRGHHRQAAPRADRHGRSLFRGQLHQILGPGAPRLWIYAGSGRWRGSRLRCGGVLMSLRGRLTIDLDAIIANWRALDAESRAECETAAVLKADAYGLGAERVGKALSGIGIRTFFVAVAAEGEALRKAIGPNAVIYVLGGYARDSLARYRTHDLRPVLNSAEQARAWFSDRPGAPA